MNPDINTRLLELNELYSEMGQKATTDFDEIRSHRITKFMFREIRG